MVPKRYTTNLHMDFFFIVVFSFLLLLLYWKRFLFSFMLQSFSTSLRQPDAEATGTVTNHNVRLKLLNVTGRQSLLEHLKN